MASFPGYFQRDPQLFSPAQIQQHRLPPPSPPPPPPPPAIYDTKDAPDGTVATFLVRHLPEGITDDMLSRLFSHYGATSVRPCSGGRLRNCAFVDFKDESLASQAHLQLHRLRFLGKVITVDRADKTAMKNINPQNLMLSSKDASMLSPKDASFPPNDLGYSGEPIAPRLGVDYPFPSHLEYVYPPPDGNILTNIVNALIAVPKLYTQVLHLMNKMNLPAPFRMALPTPPLPPPVPAPPLPPPPAAPKPQKMDLSSSESELESSEEDTGGGHSRKRAKKEIIVGPAVDSGVEHKDVGLKAATLVPKELPMIKKRNPVLQIKISTKPTQKDIVENEKISEPLEAAKEGKSYLTAEEISRGKRPLEELLSLPMFKNYAPGSPATVLYIKNLAKDVVADDFYFIFGSLFENSEVAKSSLNIKLMQEGRMRGQSFVTFPNVDLAHRALNLVNGYQFKGKPIIIQFGRSSSVKAN